MHRLVLAAPFLALIACGDIDGDGLTNGRENHLGSNPELADTDGDGMNDRDEVKAHCDPVLWDTDGDGYSDYQEIDYGSDPLDVASFVYLGGWPYNPGKEALEDPGLSGTLAVGERVGRFVALDQFGEEVDFYDYGNQGKPVMVDISAMWCGPCKQIAGWLGGDAMGGMSSYEIVRESVENGDLLWVTIVGQDTAGNYPDPGDLVTWDTHYGAEGVAALADTADTQLVDYFRLPFWPAIYLLDEDLTLIKGPSQSTWEPPLAEAKRLLEGGE